jgi:hypothetical protein
LPVTAPNFSNPVQALAPVAELVSTYQNQEMLELPLLDFHL